MRSATPEDLPLLRELARTALVYDPDAAAIVDLLWSAAADGCRIVVEVAEDTAVAEDAEDAEDPAVAENAEPAGSPGPRRLIGFAFGSLRPARGGQPATGHLDLFLVDAAHRGRGHGRALLTELERRLVIAGARRLRIRGNPPTFAWPGIDIRYTPAVCLAAAAGYGRLMDADNMLVDLTTANLATEADEHRLAAAGIEVR